MLLSTNSGCDVLEVFAKDLISPHGAASIVAMLLALFARDVVVGMLRAYAKRAHTDKDPTNDAAADAADVIADSITRLKMPGGK
jgi:hypothetical protein